MKKILIALPLVLVMLLSMIPVMAAEQVSVSINALYYEQPDSVNHFKQRFENEMIDKAIASDKDKLEAEVTKIVKGWGYPHDKSDWTVKVAVTPYIEAKSKVVEGVPLTVSLAEEKYKEKKPNFSANTDKMTYITAAGKAELDKDPVGTLTKEMFTNDIKAAATIDKVTQEAVAGQAASATATVKPNCKTEKDEEPKCVVLCSEITVKLRDVHNGKFLDAYEEVISVNPNVAPDYQAVIDLYMRDLFPWHAYQPLKNYLNVYSILTPKNLEDCEIIIDVLPKYETIQIIHELYDCCITPDGKVKEDLYMSFIEDDEAFRKTGTPDGFLEIPFLEFHTGLMVNQDKAAEYAKTRLEKVNATDFVFQKATFFDGIKASAYVNGVVGLDGKVKVVKNDVPTIVIKYLRGECVKTDEKVDNAKVEAGVQTTTNAPAQQLPATGAKDITAFFMSAVALLGLGIFFAKKH